MYRKGELSPRVACREPGTSHIQLLMAKKKKKKGKQTWDALET
jgi:hypothetical protein